jgi:hypothetical protein
MNGRIFSQVIARTMRGAKKHKSTEKKPSKRKARRDSLRRCRDETHCRQSAAHAPIRDVWGRIFNSRYALGVTKLKFDARSF